MRTRIEVGRWKVVFLSVLGLTLMLGTSRAQATTYTSDHTLSDFTSGVAAFGTFTQDSSGDPGTTPPYTPTVGNVNAGLRVIGGGNTTPIIVKFPFAVNQIRVFPNIDHFGSAYDGFQYSIAGSNDGVTFTSLFNALTVTGAVEPFTLGTFAGTAPVSVNNVLTPGAGPNGTVGYEADFAFSQAYQYYSFGASSEAINSGNPDQELSAVAGFFPCFGAAGVTPGKPNCHGKCVSFLARTDGGIDNASSDLGYASVADLQDVIQDFCGN